MIAITKIEERDNFGRQVFFLVLESAEALPAQLNLPTPYFVLFLAWDVEQVDDYVLYDFAEKLIAFGTVYMCAWGQGCSRVDDAFDLVWVMRDINKGEQQFPHIMTTWHPNDSLDEALWFALNTTNPDDEIAHLCGTTLVISVGGNNWDAHLLKQLQNQQQLNEDVICESDKNGASD